MTRTLLLIGIIAILYSIVSNSFLMFLEGLFLVYLGIHLTFEAWQGRRLEV